MQPSHCKEMVHGEPSEPSCTCSKRTTKHCPCTPAQLAVPDRAGFIPRAVRNGRVLKLSRTLSASQPLHPCARGLFCLRSMHQRHTHTSAACAVPPDFWQKCDAIERFVCFCVCRKNPLALRAKMLPRAQFCYLRRSRFSTCCRQVFDTLFNNILYISALQTTMSCGIVHHAAQEAVVATADMHQRRRLSHCTQKTATRKAGGQGAGDNHQGERK